MAYVLGFFAADGNIIKNKRGAHFFSIGIKEKDILHAIRRVMDSNHKIGVRKRENGILYTLQIGSKEIFYDLARLGFGGKKTHRMAIPIMPKKFLPCFIRGYFDGDGNIWLGYKHKDRKKPLLTLQSCFTSCSEGFIESLYKNLKEAGLVGGSLYKRDNVFKLSYSTHDSLKLYRFMYFCYSTCDLCLQGKKKVFEKYLKKMRP